MLGRAARRTNFARMGKIGNTRYNFQKNCPSRSIFLSAAQGWAVLLLAVLFFIGPFSPVTHKRYCYGNRQSNHQYPPKQLRNRQGWSIMTDKGIVQPSVYQRTQISRTTHNKASDQECPSIAGVSAVMPIQNKTSAQCQNRCASAKHEQNALRCQGSQIQDHRQKPDLLFLLFHIIPRQYRNPTRSTVNSPHPAPARYRRSEVPRSLRFP